MSREDPQIKLRLPLSMRTHLQEMARVHGRSMNAEILSRLEAGITAEVSEDSMHNLMRGVNDRLGRIEMLLKLRPIDNGTANE